MYSKQSESNNTLTTKTVHRSERRWRSERTSPSPYTNHGDYQGKSDPGCCCQVIWPQPFVYCQNNRSMVKSTTYSQTAIQQACLASEASTAWLVARQFQTRQIANTAVVEQRNF
ncbi:hypothetical protein RRG08_025133 [Elysia crispata]|uniref:Uncharacterized protein n=1 Tax=Elysia crispata TaxID=231223 RepID=A0AAE0ZV20_9GAST|nr:hypothetical protein RRG08_025133 [Elysia crispata]